MRDKQLLSEGLAILSACKKQTGDLWHAHYGVAAIACYFMAKENRLSPEISDSMFLQAFAIVDKHRLTTREPLRDQQTDVRTAEQMILQSLEVSIDQLHWVGHNVIYSSLTLLALRELDGWGTINDVNEIGELIRSFEKTIPGRSWLGYSASEVRRMTIVEEDRIPPLDNAQQLSEFILSELSEIKTVYRAESHHDLLGHMLTYSHALNLLFDLGQPSLFRRGLFPLLQLVKALRSSRNLRHGDPIKLVSPVDVKPLAEAAPATYLPIEQAYWLADHSHHDWDYGHHFKFAFSYYNHLNRAPQFEERTKKHFRQIIGSCDS